ncbi:MAG: hypothetical protein BWX52_01988 [Bacteroidetes bacterium ADurb.Bin013]|nr:MAG: hypothetical protein BWX52_01988 [Bacteroidetes bacterium ADurb.Bin013]
MELARTGQRGSVLTVTREKKASVPSDPTIRCVIISKGSSNSTKGSRFRPVTFLMLYLYRICFTRAGLPITFSRICINSVRNLACVQLKESRDALFPVSSIVPSARTRRMERTILSLLAWVPQFIPEALLAMMPPTMADEREAGSGENFLP